MLHAEGEHVCCRYGAAACDIVHLFGNVFRCSNTGQVHICDRNCTQRVPTAGGAICRISRLLLESEPVATQRKRGSTDDGLSATKKSSFDQWPQPQPLVHTGPDGAMLTD